MVMEVLERIRKEILKNGTTSQSMVTSKCSICGDMEWVQNENGCYSKCICAEMKLIRKCWENYGVKPEEVKPLRDYEGYHRACVSVKNKAAAFVTDYEKIKTFENNWFGLFGQSGAGKSHIIIAMGAALLNTKSRPVKAVYMPFLEAMRELKANVWNDEYYIKLSGRYQRAEVLVIDDLFKDKLDNGKLAYKLSDTDMRHVYPIINYRYYNRLPTLISSECTPTMLLDLDEAIGGRILERCNDNVTVFVGAEFNYRLKKFERGEMV